MTYEIDDTNWNDACLLSALYLVVDYNGKKYAFNPLEERQVNGNYSNRVAETLAPDNENYNGEDEPDEETVAAIRAELDLEDIFWNYAREHFEIEDWGYSYHENDVQAKEEN